MGTTLFDRITGTLNLRLDLRILEDFGRERLVLFRLALWFLHHDPIPHECGKLEQPFGILGM